VSLQLRTWYALAPIALLGCATAYRNEAGSSITGGGFREEGPGKLVKVGFSGNSFIDGRTTDQYALFRAAEYAQASGKPYFVVYKSMRDAAKDRRASEANVGFVGGKPQAFVWVRLLDEDASQAMETAAVLKRRDEVLAAGTSTPDAKDEVTR